MLTINNFIEALSSSTTLHFNTLVGCKIITDLDGCVSPVSSTTELIEFVMEWNNELHRMYMWPRQEIKRCFCKSELVRTLSKLKLPMLTNCHYFGSEFIVFDDGNKFHHRDVMLEQIPIGKSLSVIISTHANDTELLTTIKNNLETIASEWETIPIAHGKISRHTTIVTPDNKIILTSYAKMELKGEDSYQASKASDRKALQQLTELVNTTIAGAIIIENNTKAYSKTVYDTINEFCENVAGASINGKWRLIGISGKPLTPLKYSNIGEVNEGYCVVSIDRLKGVIHKSGREVIPVMFDDIITPERNGLFIVIYENRWWLKDYQGNDISNRKFEHISDFYGAFAPAKSNGKWGVIDSKGNVKIPFIYDSVSKESSDTEHFTLRIGTECIESKIM